MNITSRALSALTVWNPSANDGTITLSLSNDRVYAGGYFTSIDGAVRGNFAFLVQ